MTPRFNILLEATYSYLRNKAQNTNADFDRKKRVLNKIRDKKSFLNPDFVLTYKGLYDSQNINVEIFNIKRIGGANDIVDWVLECNLMSEEGDLSNDAILEITLNVKYPKVNFVLWINNGWGLPSKSSSYTINDKKELMKFVNILEEAHVKHTDIPFPKTTLITALKNN